MEFNVTAMPPHLNRRRIARSQNRQELIVRDEEESGKRVSLRVQIIGERFLGSVQTLAEVFESLEPILRRTGLHNIRVLVSLGADLECKAVQLPTIAKRHIGQD